MTTPAQPTVLIVDDEPVIRMLARASLSAAGYAVSEAGSLAEAADAVRNAAGPFDLILLDLTLQGEEGRDLIPQVRALAPGTRILVVSGADEGEVEGLDADGFLSKPFTRASLLEAARNARGA